MEQFAIKVSGVFSDIYKWGVGYVNADMKSKWDWFWQVEFRNKAHLFWKYSNGDDFGGCGHLSCIGGNIYMHPMDFKAVLISSGVTSISRTDDGKEYCNHFESEIRELNEICKECAEFCGGHFTLTISKEFSFDTPDANMYYDELVENGDYVSKVGVEREKNAYSF